MLRIMTLVVQASVLLLSSGCGMPRQDPFAEIVAAQGAKPAPGRDLTAVLALSKNTIAAMSYMSIYRGVGGAAEGQRMFEGLANDVQRSFKSVVKADSIEQAKTIDADVVIVLDVVADVGINSEHAEVSAIILGRDGRQIDVVKAEDTESALSHPFSTSGYIGALASGIIAKFQEALYSSTKLAEFARSKAPASVAAAAPAPAPVVDSFRSDVDAPTYRVSPNPDDFALVIGIGSYSDLPEARFAERDAQIVRKHLVALGYPERNVISLLGSKASGSAIKKYLDTWLPSMVNERSTVFVYYSGHGAPDLKTGRAFLVPWDGDPQFLSDTAYPVSRLYEKLGALKAKRVIVALDSCFSGAGGRSVLAKGARPLITKIDMGELSDKVVALTASGPDQISGSLEDQGHGLFTYYLLKGLNGAAQDSSGHVTVKSLFDFLGPNVADEARRQNRDQAPRVSGQGLDEIDLR